MKLIPYEKQLAEDFRERLSSTSNFRGRASEVLNIFWDLLIYGDRYIDYRREFKRLIEEHLEYQREITSDNIRIVSTPIEFIEAGHKLMGQKRLCIEGKLE